MYIFQGGTETCRVELTKDKRLKISGQMTGFKFVDFSPKLFKDREKRNKANLLISKLPKLKQKEIDVYLCLEFAKMGYALVKKNVNGTS